MRKRLIQVLLFSAFLGLILLQVPAEISAQPNQFNITNIEPNTLYPGTVFAVNGGQFLEDNSQVYIGEGFALETYFESANKLVAIVPLEPNICGEQGIIVKTEVNINNSPAEIDSNFVVKDIQCQNQNNLTPATPTISNVTQLDLVSGEAAIRIEGRNLIPSGDGYTFYGRYTNNGSYPYTEVRVYNSDYEYTGRGQYQSFGAMRYEFPEDVYCGQYSVELKNYFSESQVSNPNIPSAAAQVEIDEYCTDNAGPPPENGEAPSGYEVMNLDLPSTAYVDEQIDGSVQVRYQGNGTFYGRYFGSELELYVDGQLRDTQELDMDPNERLTFPLTFNFDRPGMHEIEVRVGESYQRATISVERRNGTGPPPSEPPSDQPPAQGASDLSDYDMDGDCRMSDTEFFVATDAWIAENISDLLFFSAVDAWIGQSNICTAASGGALSLRQTSRGLLISSSVEDALGAVTIYDTSGRVVHQSTSSSSKLFWNLRDRANQPVANGVYLVRLASTNTIAPFVVMH